jgi:hypothetical protein
VKSLNSLTICTRLYSFKQNDSKSILHTLEMKVNYLNLSSNDWSMESFNCRKCKKLQYTAYTRPVVCLIRDPPVSGAQSNPSRFSLQWMRWIQITKDWMTKGMRLVPLEGVLGPAGGGCRERWADLYGRKSEVVLGGEVGVVRR